MQTKSNSSVLISRYFSASPQKVWQAWTNPQIVKTWFGSDPNGNVLDASLDVRLDGKFEFTFENSDHSRYTCTGKYKEIEPYKKLVFTWVWKNQPDIVELVSVLLQAQQDGTLMTFEHSNIDDRTAHNYEVGWKSTFEKLARTLGTATHD